MIDAQWWSIACAVILVAVLAVAHRRVFSFSGIGVFFLSNLIFVALGVLLAPWLIQDRLLLWYSYLRLDLLSEADLIRANTVVVGGMLLTLAGHWLIDLMIFRPCGRSRRPRSAVASAADSAWVLPKASYAITTVAIGLAAGIFATKWDVFVHGLFAGYVEGIVTEVYASREGIQELGYLYYTTIFNVLPFLAVLLLVYSTGTPSKAVGVRLVASLVVLVTGLLLLATFEKRPFVIFILLLGFAYQLTKACRVEMRIAGRIYFPFHAKRWGATGFWRAAMLAGLTTFTILIGLYYLSTSLHEAYADGLDQIRELAEIVVSRVFGRLAVEPLVYAFYFPAIHPHYGFSNIGALATLLDTTYYADTVETLRYFSAYSSGSGAIGALVDFYGAHGWLGLLVGSLGLGLLLNIIDRWYESLVVNPLNITVYSFMLLFAYYLSQASLARCLSSYGGAMAILLWLVMCMRISGRRASYRRPNTISSSVEDV